MTFIVINNVYSSYLNKYFIRYTVIGNVRILQWCTTHVQNIEFG